MLLITVIVVKGLRVSIVKAKGRPRGHNEATSLPQREIHERKRRHPSLPSILLARGVTNDSFAKTITIALFPGTGDDRRERKYVMPDE